MRRPSLVRYCVLPFSTSRHLCTRSVLFPKQAFTALRRCCRRRSDCCTNIVVMRSALGFKGCLHHFRAQPVKASFCLEVSCSIPFLLEGLGQIVWTSCDQVLLLVAACRDFPAQFWGGDEAEAARSQGESATEAADVFFNIKALFFPCNVGSRREDWTQGLTV